MTPTDLTGLREIKTRLFKRAAEIEALAVKFPSWEISEARQHAQDIRDFVRANEAENERLREALKPFGDIDGEGADDFPDDTPVRLMFGRSTVYRPVTLGHLRAARQALNTEGESDG